MFSPDHSDRAEQQAKDTADYRDALQSSADFADKASSMMIAVAQSMTLGL